jgi:hypothetical protein
MEIRSYRTVFELERRIYRVDSLRLNPTGVPVRGVVYGLGLIVGVLACQSLLPLRSAMSVLPWYVTDLALPVGAAALLTVVRIDGRPFHLAVQALMGHRLTARRLVGVRPLRAGWRAGAGHGHGPALGGRWWPPDVLLLPDGSDARMRRLRYVGPGAVLVAVPYVCEGKAARRGGRAGRGRVRLRERSALPGTEARDVGGAGGTVIALAAKARLRAG